MTKPKDAPERLNAIMTALADHAESLIDKDVLAEGAAEGLDPKKEGAAVRTLLLGAVLRGKKDRLRKAEEAHKQAVIALATRTAQLPETPAERRALLGRVVQRRPQMRDALTLQHRQFESLSDADVESALKQLDALGLLEDGEPNGDPDPKP